MRVRVRAKQRTHGQLRVLGEPDALLDCYEGAGCSVVDLIECRRLEEADRL